MNIDLTEITVILGQKNSGKSVLTEHLLTQMDRYLGLDPNHEHGPPDSIAVSTPAESLREWVNGNTRQVVRDGPLTEEKAEQYMRVFGQLQDAYLVIDEAHNYMGPHRCPEILEDMARWYVSHSNGGLVLGAHKAKDIHDAIWQQVDNYFIFSYGDHEDAKLSSVSIPDKHRVHSLDPASYQFLSYKDVAGADSEIRGPVPVPSHPS